MGSIDRVDDETERLLDQTLVVACHLEHDPQRSFGFVVLGPCARLFCLEQMEVWGPNEQRDVRCRQHGRDQDVGLVSFIVDDDEARQPVVGSVACAVFQTAADGTVMVPVINLSRFGLAADQGDAVLGARALCAEDICLDESLTDGRAQQQLSKDEQELLKVHRDWKKHAERRGWQSSSILEPPEEKTADSGQHDVSGSASQVARELFVSGTKRASCVMAGSQEGCSSQEADLSSALSMESDSKSAAEVVDGLIKGLPPEEGPDF